MRIVAVILTKNESRHLVRCLSSIRSVVDEVIVVDSGSDDETVAIAKEAGASVYQRNWVNYSDQYSWAQGQVKNPRDWILRIDADEYLSAELIDSIVSLKKRGEPVVSGFILRRVISFMGQEIRHGGVYPGLMLRLYRNSCGAIETRWMDEHIVVSGEIEVLHGDLIDENLNDLSWWIAKHNSYASREAVDLLLSQFCHGDCHETATSIQKSNVQGKAKVVRWMKQKVYHRAPPLFRAWLYFAHRYIIRCGFLDGRAGLIYHFLQCCWYRFLVDAKIAEVNYLQKRERLSLGDAIYRSTGIKVHHRPSR